MGRHAFNSFLYDLYGCEGSNNVTADTELSADDISIDYIEVFNSPKGLVVAVHHDVNGVLLIRPLVDIDEEVSFIEDGNAPTPDPDFVEWGSEDDKRVGMAE